MIVICRDNEGFEDRLTAGQEYTVTEVSGGSFKVYTDTRESLWFGSCKFGQGIID